MQFTNSFTVPLPPDEAWRVLLDIQRIAPCIPGAELTEVVDERTYKGKIAVRLGPVALAFASTARFEEIDHAAHRAVMKAQGSDVKGRGAVGALVTFRLEPCQAGSRVEIDTDLNLSGSVAQYGRGAGMIQSVASRLIDQFAGMLKEEIARSQPANEQATPAPLSAPRSAAAKPIGGLSLLLHALWGALVGLFRRDRGQKPAP